MPVLFPLPSPLPVNRHPLLRSIDWAVLALALASACFQPAQAADTGHTGHADHGTKPAPAAKKAATDPMDQLRQKLAERLGAQKPADVRAPGVMRVDNRAAPASLAGAGSVAPSAAAARPAAHPPAASKHVASKPTEPMPRPNGGRAAPWGYGGEVGPEAWAQIKPEYSQCATGQRQSPIDIRGGIAVQLEPIQFDYRTSGFSVIDDGHTVQVNLPPGNAISVLGRRFELLQFHFHRPSEERINGRQYDMVAHFLHKDAEGKLAMVAVLLDRGVAQPVIQAVWNALPLEKNEAQAAPGTIDLNKLLPEDRRYYTYMGSLTTPPCSEGVLWMVMKTPVPMSPEQIDIFAHLYPMNARPVQQAAGRLIKESN